MSDNLYEKYQFPENDDKALPVNDTARSNDAAQAYDLPQNNNLSAAKHMSREPQSDRPADAAYTRREVQQPYANPYADPASYQQQPPQSIPVQPREESAFRNPYHSADASSYSRPAANPTPDRAENEFGDGYYQNYSRSADADRNVYSSSSDNTNRPVSQWSSTESVPEKKSPKKSGGGLTKGGIALLLVICVIVSGLAGFGGSILAQNINKSKYETNADGTMIVHKVNTEIETGEKTTDKSTETITNEVADTVVEITTEIMQTNSFYGQYISQGAGSGVIISQDGYIVTNNHVIEGASSIKVTTRGGDNYDAKLIGTDSKVDIALLKIEATDLPVAIMGDSSKLAVGAKAVIIGNPLGTLGGSVTEGIISALDRSIDIDGKTMHLIQTDASINPGNSGGGMFDGQGTLSGIVVAKSSSEEIDNIGFVIPINDVSEIIGDLKEYGYVRGRADTGMTFMDLSNNMFAWYYYGTSEAGVYINSVENGSNAAKAGFMKGDRVVSLDGKEVKKSDDITTVINDKSAGDKVTFEIDRGGSTKSIELTLEEDVPDNNNSGSNSSGNSGNGGSGGNESPYGQNPFSGLW